MKTNFHRRFNPTASRTRLVLILVVFALGAVLLLSGVRGVVLKVFTPLWHGENFVSSGVKNFLSLLRDKQTLVRENNALREELVSYDSLLLSSRTLESSRDALLQEFGRGTDSGGIAAGVLVHPPETPYDVLLIDAGNAEGVKVGAMASLPQGGALGKVIEVSANVSKVGLYSTGGEETPAFLERGSIPVVLVGAGGGTFKFSLPRDSSVEVGDKVLLPGVRNELIGVVREVSLEPTDAEKHILVSGVANIGGLRFVLIH